MKAGQTFTIEPMINAGTFMVYMCITAIRSSLFVCVIMFAFMVYCVFRGVARQNVA